MDNPDTPLQMSTRSVEASLEKLNKGEDWTITGTTGKIDDHVLPPFDTSIGCKELDRKKLTSFVQPKFTAQNCASP